MKELKVWVSRFIAGVMAMMCVVGSSTPLYTQAAESTSGVYYVALGDSITAGDSTYVSKVSAHLKSTYGSCTTKNLAVSGMTSAALADILTNPANSYYSTYRNAIKKANVITLDIGSNDIFGKAMEVISDCFGCTPDQIGAVSESWVNRIQSANSFQMFLLYMEAMGIARNINSRLNNGTEMGEALASFESSYKLIISTIKKLAPNAKVYIGNLYNPYVDAASVYLGDYEVLNMEEFSKVNVQKANTIIKNNAGGYAVVDLYNTLNNPKHIQGDVVNADYNPHPNAAGQAAIANKFIAAMK